MTIADRCRGMNQQDGASLVDTAWIAAPPVVSAAVVANLWFGGKVVEAASGRELDAMAFLLAVVSVMGLALCRKHPRAALAVVIAASMTYNRAGYPSHPGQFAIGVVLLLAFLRGARWEAAVLSALAGIAAVAIGPSLLSEESIYSLGRTMIFLIPTVPILIGLAVWGYQWRSERLAQELTLTRQSHAASVERDSERQRVAIARDLHDTVGHSIAVISVQSGAALSVLDSDPESARAALVAINDSCRNAMGATKQALAALRGDRTHPAPTLEATIMTARGAGLDVEVAQSGSLEDVDHRVVDTVHRLAQESLTNTLKHAGQAAHVDLLLNVDDQAVRFEFADDGEMVDSIDLRNESGSGLQGMEARVTELGGRFEAGLTRGGFRVFAELPVSGDQA